MSNLHKALTAEYLMSLTREDRKRIIQSERIKCASNYRYLIETYFTVDNGGTIEPFILYPHQVTALQAYIDYSNNISMKSRQMGFTTFTSAFAAAEMINHSGYKVVIISKEQNSSIEFVRKIKEILDNARNNTRLSNREGSVSWLIPEYEEGFNNKKSFRLTNGSFVEGQGNSDNSGRGVSGVHLLIVDEVAFIDHSVVGRMDEIWGSAGPALSTTGGKAIMISTPYGTKGWYYDTYINADAMGFNIINAHWSIHPVFNKGMYKWIKDPNKKAGGYIKFFNKEWPEELDDPKTKRKVHIPKTKYEFICDGKLRSPWYDFMSRRLGPKKTARELDCTFTGTGGEVLSADLIKELDLYAREVQYRKVFKKGPISFYKEFEKPNDESQYMISCDVMTGDGSDYSTLVVLKINGENVPVIVGTLKIQIQPKYLAIIIKELAERFNNALIVVENQGGGSTTLAELKERNIGNIYYSTLKKKDEFGGGQKRKIGLWQTEDTRTKGGDELEILLNERELLIPCTNMVHELYTWVWSKAGRRDHAPGKNDDLILALQNGIYVWKYFIRKKIRTGNNNIGKIMTDNYDNELEMMTDPLYEEKEIMMAQKVIANKKNKNKENKGYVPKLFLL